MQKDDFHSNFTKKNSDFNSDFQTAKFTKKIAIS